MKAKKLRSKFRGSRIMGVKLQCAIYCITRGIKYNDNLLAALAEVSLKDSWKLNELCERLAEIKLYKTPQVARNAVIVLEKRNLVIKTDAKKQKLLSVNSEIGLVGLNPFLIDFQYLSIDGEENVPGPTQNDV